MDVAAADRASGTKAAGHLTASHAVSCTDTAGDVGAVDAVPGIDAAGDIGAVDAVPRLNAAGDIAAVDAVPRPDAAGDTTFDVGTAPYLYRDGGTTVSYTHLDVYKRQLLYGKCQNKYLPLLPIGS